MKEPAFIKRSNGSHRVGDGFPVKEIFFHNDIAEEMSSLPFMGYAGPTDFPSTARKLGVGGHPHRCFGTMIIDLPPWNASAEIVRSVDDFHGGRCGWIGHWLRMPASLNLLPAKD